MSVWNFANPHLKTLVAYEPGKPIDELARELGLDPAHIVKLASNENPLGPSPKAMEAVRNELPNLHIYPDGGAYRLREALAAKFGLDRSHIVVGNGSNEIIELIGHAFLRPGDEIVVAKHAFLVYKLMAQVFGATTVEVDDPNFTHDLDAMAAAVTERTRQIFITNPNNPTGTLVSQEDIDRFMAKIPAHVVVIFDEAYHEFLDEPPDTLKYVREGRNVVVLRTFSKIQGLAALRVGYGFAPPEIAELLQRARQPFNVNHLAQIAAVAGLEDEEHQRRTKEMTDEGRERLQSAFSKRGLNFVPSHANFVLVEVGDGDAVFKALLHRGVIVRAMRAYGLPAWIRVTIGTTAQNAKFLDELERTLA